jgi:hypothetical protein
MSNTLHLSGDKWELSGRPLLSMQTIVLIDVITPKLAPVETGEPGQKKSAGCLESGAQPSIRRSDSGTDAPKSGAGARGSRAGLTACAASTQHVSVAHRKWARTHRHCGYRADFGSNHCGEVGQYFG